MSTREPLFVVQEGSIEVSKCCKPHTAHVHQADDSYFTGAKGFHIPDDDIEAFEIHNVIYNHAELCRLREISQQERTNDFYRLYPEYAKPAAGAESETCG